MSVFDSFFSLHAFHCFARSSLLVCYIFCVRRRFEISFNVIDIIEQIIVEALAELNRAITEMLVKP